MASHLEPNRHTSLLHAGYHHPLHRTWQAGSPITSDMLMYPIFVTDNDNVEEKIDTLPGQSRYSKKKMSCQAMKEKVHRETKGVSS